MRLLTLSIAILVFAGVGYVSLSTPSHATIFNGDVKVASASVTH